MTYEMPKLPYANNALEPVISQQTIDYHYGKHLQTYVNNLNNLVPGTEFEGKDLITIVSAAPDGAIFNNAGQVLNHTLYFLQFSPKPGHNEPVGKLAAAIKKMETDVGIADLVSVGIRFIEWIRPIDLDKAKEVTILWDKFIKDQL